MKNLLALAAALFLLGILKPLQAQKLENSLLWEISGNGLSKPSFLFGTYHLLNDGYLGAEQPRVLDAFKKADGVVVEVVIDTPAMMKAQMGMVMPDNRLSNLLDSAQYQTVKAELQAAMGIDLGMLEQIKPIAISTMLSMAYTAGSPVLSRYSGQPLDQYFAAEGKRSGKTVAALETIEEQVDVLFNHFSLKEQADILVEMVTTKERGQQINREIIDSYIAQNISGLDEIEQQTQKEMPAWGSMDFINADRNKRWMEKLPAILKSGNRFIAVGALHLPGEQGLIQLLRKQGYTVKPIIK
jgi:uncharacterized protein YbaP (TraB family)